MHITDFTIGALVKESVDIGNHHLTISSYPLLMESWLAQTALTLPEVSFRREQPIA
jgi:hypothetical protein